MRAGSPLEKNDQIREHPGFLRFTYDPLTLPGNEPMGLVGAGYFLDIEPWLYGGLSVYGAVSGQRGGFFTGGFEVGVRRNLAGPFSVDAGLFIGGGGGGAAPQGGGLMLRPHLGLNYGFGDNRIGLNLAQVYFPNGNINSTQLGIVYKHDVMSVFGSGWSDATAIKTSSKNVGAKRLDWATTIRRYQPPTGTLGTGGQPHDNAIGLLGFSLARYWTPNTYLMLEAAGAANGDANGYAEILFGPGYRWTLGQKTWFNLDWEIGAAGGGRVDTGGGFISRLKAGLRHNFSHGWFGGIEAGYIIAPGGDFMATVVGLKLGYRLSVADLTETGQATGSEGELQPRRWRLRGVHQNCFPGNSARRIDLLGVKVDTMITKHGYLIGQALGAYNGGAGGYAVGMLGAGITGSSSRRWRPNAEITFGAAGGGGVNVGGGFVIQSILGLEYVINSRMGLMVSAGGIVAPGGSFRAAVAEIGVVYRFKTLEWY